MRAELTVELHKIQNEFVISNNTLLQISNEFLEDMTEKEALKMLKTHIVAKNDKVLPNEYVAIDIGGTNMRVGKLKISNDSVVIEKLIKVSLKTAFRDYTSDKYSIKDLFKIALQKIEPFLDRNKLYSLAVTVSFGIKSATKENAMIIELSKGFELKNTIGEDISDVLKEVISELNLKLIPVAIINDCVATMVTGRFFNPNADISMIVGTGHNSCFVNKDMEVINIESANFSKNIPLTGFDSKVLSRMPGECGKVLEVLTGGKYIGKIANAMIEHLVECGLLKECKAVTTDVLTKCMDGEFDFNYSAEQREVIGVIANILFERSAKLIASEIFAVLMFIDKELENKHTVIFDGSVYENCKFFREQIARTLSEILVENSDVLSFKLIKDASIMGPAIVSATLVTV